MESRIADQLRKIANAEMELTRMKAYLDGLQDSLKLLPQEGAVSQSKALRDGSDLAKARDILKQEGKAVHLDELLRRIGKEANRNNKGALGGSLSGYVRKGQIFTRPGPNVFGLLEFENVNAPEAPPEDFGLNGGKA